MNRFILITLLCATNCLLANKLAAQPVNFIGSELVGRPTLSSITINVIADQPLDVYFEYGTQPGAYTDQTGIISSPANEPIETVITGLQGNTRYYYRMLYRISGNTAWTPRSEHHFHTQRPPGSSFTFAIGSDSHLNDQPFNLGNPTLYQQTMQNINNDDPDLYFDLGDTFFMDNVTTVTTTEQRYLAQRPYMGIVGQSAPVFLALGNHENEEGWNLDDDPDPANTMPVMSTNARKKYYLNPIPDNFYSGNTDTHPSISGDHLHEDYYAFEWGDALFVVIDPFWYTTIIPYAPFAGETNDETPSGDRWNWTLGQQQFNWLQQTLENSDARFKFIFAHHMVGGTQNYVRGGADAAHWFEWGGENQNGTWAFDTKRPGWGNEAIHQIMVANHVTAFFHGHDHQFAYEKRDGIVYQEVPMLAATNNNSIGFPGLYNESNPYTIRVLPNSGHLRVTVSPNGATVDYVRSFISGGTNGQVSYSYIMDPGQGSPLPVEMESFTLQTQDNKKVILNWKTVSELQNKQFIIQRASAPSGSFRDIGTVPGTNFPDGASYSFTDEPGLSGSYLYRLIQEDIDGRQNYSGIRSATLNNKKFWQLTENSNSWQLQTIKPARYTLLDMQGRVIETGNCNGTKQISKPAIHAVYMLRIECDGEISIRQIRS